MESVPEVIETKELDRFPSADRDIAIIINENVRSEDIRNEILRISNGLASEVRIFDLYRGKNIPENKKSLAFGIKYRLRDRTLTDSEVDTVHEKIAEVLAAKFDAELRK